VVMGTAQGIAPPLFVTDEVVAGDDDAHMK
jgi:hypothetical protein